MKKPLCIVFLLLCLTKICFGGNTKDTGKAIGFSSVIEATDSTLSSTLLFGRCLKWVASTFNSGKTVIDIQDKESGFIIAKPTFQATVPYLATGYVVDINYVLKISIKTGKLRVEEENYVVSCPSDCHTPWILTDSPDAPFKGMGKKVAQKEWLVSKQAVADHFQNTVSSLRKLLDEKDAEW